MKTKIQNALLALALLALSTLNPQLSTAFAQGTTAFTYQGQLRNGGTNANGECTMARFELRKAEERVEIVTNAALGVTERYYRLIEQ